MDTQLNFAVIADQKELKAKNIYFQRNKGKVGKEFESHVLASIAFYYGAGNKQIAIINGLLSIEHQARSGAAPRLAHYLSQVVPCKLDKGDARTAPQFGKKIKKQDFLSDKKLADFVYRNARWSIFAKPSKQSSFVIATAAKTCAKLLVKNNVIFADFMSAVSTQMDELKKGAA